MAIDKILLWAGFGKAQARTCFAMQLLIAEQASQPGYGSSALKCDHYSIAPLSGFTLYTPQSAGQSDTGSVE